MKVEANLLGSFELEGLFIIQKALEPLRQKAFCFFTLEL